MALSTSLFRKCLLLLSLLGLAASCQKPCEDNQPRYTISTGARAWADPFAVDAVWRFRNAAGYERSYRVTKQETQSIGTGGGKFSVCSAYYEEYIFADMVRTDSALSKKIYHLQLVSPDKASTKTHPNFLQWEGRSFALPIEEAEAGQLALLPATLGGRTYPAVMVRTNIVPAPTTQQLYLTKAEGVVAFDDQYGTLWTRL